WCWYSTARTMTKHVATVAQMNRPISLHFAAVQPRLDAYRLERWPVSKASSSALARSSLSSDSGRDDAKSGSSRGMVSLNEMLKYGNKAKTGHHCLKAFGFSG